MTDNSLKALTGVIHKMAEDTNVTRKSLESLQKSICGTDGLISSILSLTEYIKESNDKKKEVTPAKILRKDDKSHKESLKISNDISKSLGMILKEMKNMNKGKSKDNISQKKSDFKMSDSSDSKKFNFKNLDSSIDVIGKLKEINIKDLILSKTKLNHIENMMSKAKDIFKSFESNDEIENTIGFINSSVDMIENMKKISKLSRPAKKAVNILEDILFGNGKKIKGGLVGILRKLDSTKNQHAIKSGKKSMKNIMAACGSMVIICTALTTISILSIPATIGALAMKGIVFLMIGTFKTLNLAKGHIAKGSMALLLMSGSILAFSLGLGSMMKSIKDMKMKDVGIMIASIAGVGLAVAGVGLLALPIAIGSASLLLIGGSIGVLGLAMQSWTKIDTSKAMGNIRLAVEGLRDVFGLELGKHDELKSPGQRLKGGLMDIAMGIFDFGKSFFTMGSILLAGAALGLLKKGIQAWDDYDASKAMGNIETSINTLKNVLGLNNEKKDETMKDKLKGLAGKALDAAGSLFQMGGNFFQLATMATAIGTMDVIRLGLIPWNEYDSSKAIGNIRNTMTGINEFLKDEGSSSVDNKDMKNFNTAANNFLDGMKDMNKAVKNIDNVTNGMNKFHSSISKWDGSISSSAVIMSTSVKKINDAFKDINENSFRKKAKTIEELSSTLSKNKIQSKYTSLPITNTVKTINSLDMAKATMITDIFKSFSKIKDRKPFDGFNKAVDKFADACHEITESIDKLEKSNNTDTTQQSSVQYVDTMNVQSGNTGSSQSPSQTGSMMISNTKEIADAISSALKNLNFRIDPSMLDINLIVDGGYGKSVKLTLQD